MQAFQGNLCRWRIAFLSRTRLTSTELPGLSLVHRCHQEDFGKGEATHRIVGDAKHG